MATARPFPSFQAGAPPFGNQFQGAGILIGWGRLANGTGPLGGASGDRPHKDEEIF
ncbi:MAG: hypothetical protein M0Z48_01080 [Nitrospiraceae bacterium]|nr:hypothetical protein [Nitrospiraceae bacterium]